MIQIHSVHLNQYMETMKFPYKLVIDPVNPLRGFNRRRKFRVLPVYQVKYHRIILEYSQSKIHNHIQLNTLCIIKDLITILFKFIIFKYVLLPQHHHKYISYYIHKNILLIHIISKNKTAH